MRKTFATRPEDEVRRRILWKKIRVWKTWYRSKAGVEILVYTVTKPTKTRVFRAAGGNRKFRAYKVQSTTREVIVVAKAAKKAKNKKAAEVEDNELEELENLEDLEALDEDTDSKPAKKGKSKTKGTTTKKKKSRSADDGVGTAELAEAAGTDGRSLRMYLRKAKITKDEDKGRYWWPSLSDPEAKKIIKAVKAGAVDEVKKEGLERLKASQAEKKAAEGKKSKKGKKAKK